MSVVTICLGESGTENYTGIVKFMDVLLSSSRAATEKKKILEEEFGVAMNEDLEREVLVMCNLSQGVKAEGREEGISIGEIDNICTFCAKALFLELCVYYKTLAGKLHPRTC